MSTFHLIEENTSYWVNVGTKRGFLSFYLPYFFYLLKFSLFSHPLSKREGDHYILLKSVCFCVSYQALSRMDEFNEINRKLIHVYNLISFTDADLQFGMIVAHNKRWSLFETLAITAADWATIVRVESVTSCSVAWLTLFSRIDLNGFNLSFLSTSLTWKAADNSYILSGTVRPWIFLL